MSPAPTSVNGAVETPLPPVGVDVARGADGWVGDDVPRPPQSLSKHAVARSTMLARGNQGFMYWSATV